MASPFPGMDPYIEQSRIWADFHSDLASEIRAYLNAQIRPAYFARLTPYTTYEVIEVAQSRLQGVRPDVGVMQRRPLLPHAGTATLTEPAPVESIVKMEAPLEIMSIEIRHASEEYLVTAIEILSPVNKQRGHEAHRDYQRKRRELLRSNVHFIEIDFLRAGERSPLDRPVPPAPYYVSLSREGQRPKILVWPIPLNARLPTIPVPLAHGDPDATLNLAQVVAAVYERGGYDVQIDYREAAPPPPLSEEEEQWVDQSLAPYRSTGQKMEPQND
ncbi:MAG: DUF4058 family protein [Caldilineaceae bacterium]|nr:DUF4058 family protein [Caldilineaceae bacterium]